jgi:vacuolar-type H+-ATPase subunit E/Vma4
MIGEESYRTILGNWIAEGVRSLDMDTAEINASPKERLLIDEGLLAEVREKLRRDHGRETKLRLSPGSALRNQGVELISGDGRVAYNNQVKTRILRKQRAIHNLIYDSLFAKAKGRINP